MVGENSKRPYPGHSPDTNLPARKIARWDGPANYQSMSNGGRVSNPSSRRSSFSQSNPLNHTGHGIPNLRDGIANLQGIPRTFGNFIVAFLKNSQSTQYLKNAETDHENTLSRHKDFPSLETQRTSRLSQAQKDFENTNNQMNEAATLLSDALNGCFTVQPVPASHQDCISRSEFDQLKDQLRANRAEELEAERLRTENHDMKKRLGKMEDLLNREIHSNKKLEDRLAYLEKTGRITAKAAESACENYSSLHESTTKDRLSCRSRCSALEAEMDKSKTKHKALDDYVLKSKAKHEEQTRSLGLFRQRVESSQQKLDSEFDSKLKDHSENLFTTRKELQELKDQVARLPVLSGPSTNLDNISGPILEDIKSRLKAAEKSVAGLEEDAGEEKTIAHEMIDELQSRLDKLQVQMDKMQTNNEEENLEKRALSEKMQEIPGDLKPQLEYINRTVETHIDLLQRHEVRFNSVTTDELYRQIESQFRQSYGTPAELRGIVQRQAKVESMYKNYYETVNNKVLELQKRCEDMATELRSIKGIMG